MAFPVTIRDPQTTAGQSVSGNGETIVRAYDYSAPHYVKLTIDDQVYNVVKGQVGRRFVMAGILIATSKAIVGDKTVQIYESLTADSGVHDTDILSIDMVKSERIYLPVTNVSTQASRHINANCDDSEVDITIFGYYIPS